MPVRFSTRCPNSDYLGFEASPEAIIAAAKKAEAVRFDGSPRAASWTNVWDPFVAMSFIAGHTMARFGPFGRGPLKDVVFQDQWGKPYPGVYLGAVERIVTEKGLPSDRRRFARLRVRRSSPLSPAVSTLKFERTAIFWDSSVFR